MSRSERKWDHIRFAIEGKDDPNSSFNDIKFIHQSIPDISLLDVLLGTNFGELSLSSPIFINAMTGGGGERTHQINKQLAITARNTGLAMAVGSQMSALKDKSERYTYEVVRKENPSGIIFANIGSESTVEYAKMAIDMLEANALQIHLNVIQELTMPEGDRDFSGTLKRIEAIVNSVNVPVIVKEVGFGMSKESVLTLSSLGVTAVDVGGYGGTNFAEIENKRGVQSLPFFNQWGIPTAISIIEASNASSQGLAVIGSGGITSAIDIAKAIAIGADAIGVAGFFLRILIEDGIDSLQEKIETIHKELSMIMTALGTKTISDLKRTPLIISNDAYHWLNQRGIDTKKYSQRTIK
jgi:isopentenyl-diphosphate Delta-isomerase